MSGISIFERAYTEELYNHLKYANTELAKKERFLQYLSVVYAGDPEAQKIISSITLGAETFIAKIPRGGQDRRGRADTQTETVIIEWEKDLSKTGNHAIEQLTEYLIGNWRSGQEYRFVLIATDGIHWRLYAPDWSYFTSGQFNLNHDFKLREVRRFDLTSDRFDDFPLFLDEILFVTTAKIASLERIQIDFGDTSAVFINSITVLNECAASIDSQSELKVAYEQWRKFLSIAYGRFDDSPSMFLVHTYLSVFSKIIAYSVVAKKQIYDDETLRAVLNGSIFKRLNVERFVEDDFFHWVVADPYFKILKLMFRELNRQIDEYDFTVVKEDILKGVYQDLIDLDTRHSLGEYYTPDWLCEKIVDELVLTPSFQTLDPACGSGSFLRAIIARLRRENPELSADKITSQVVGIDIHPLSVQISKTTVLLGLGDLISKSRVPITLHIYLANSLLVPQETANLFKSTFKVSIDNSSYSLDISGLTGADHFDRIITFCDDLVGHYTETLPKDKFIRLAAQSLPKGHSITLPQELYEVYKGLKKARNEGRDSIWKFILQNTYKPVFLRNTFDIIVGNPPWLTYGDVSNADYQNMLRLIADEYQVTPSRRANLPNLEIAAIFLAHSVNYFLKPNGVVCFVLPRSFMTADQHENTRIGDVKRVQLTKVWDLKDVEPLFRVPSCVLFAKRSEADTRNAIPETGLPGINFQGKLPKSNLHWTEAGPYIKANETCWYYSRLQSGKGRSRSALTQTIHLSQSGKNAYADRFFKGADIIPRCFYFIEVDQELNDTDLSGRVIHVKTSSALIRDAKAPWKGLSLSGHIEGDFIFRTALSKNILPFLLINPPLVVVPVTIREDNNGNSSYEVHNSDSLMESGARYTSKWFLDAESYWDKLKTAGNVKKNISLTDWLNWQGKLSRQDVNSRYLVIYTSSAQDASATVIDREQIDLAFVVDHKAYWCVTKTEDEAFYLSTYLNSGYANQQIKEFQSRGLFGPRDIHKTIVKLPFPKYNFKNEDHTKLAELGKICTDKAKLIIGDVSNIDLDSHSLGRMRSHIRQGLADYISEIDILIEKLSTGKSDAAIRSSGKGVYRKKSNVGPLFD